MPYIPYSQFMRKSAVAVLTPEAMQAAMQPPPQDPGMMGGQPPMDPSMQGGMMPPGGAPPMDPSMMGGQPPAGGQAPMPPMSGAPAPAPAPAGGLPPEIMQDQMFIQFLAEAFGVMMDPQSGQFFDPNGQPVPPEMLMQAYQAYMQAMQQVQGGAMPMDPSMMGGQPPMDQMGGAPMDPAMMQGQPPMDPAAGGMPAEGEQPMDPMMQELSDLLVAVVEDSVVTPLKDAMEAINKQMNDLKELIKGMRDEMDVVRDQVDAQEHTTDNRSEEDTDAEKALREQIAADLNPTVPVEPEVKTASVRQEPAQWRPVNIMDVLNKRG